MSKLGVILLAAVCAAGCEKGKKTATADAGAAAKQPGTDVKSPTGKPAMRRAVAPITVEEIKDSFPKIADARVIQEPTKASVGERVEMRFCWEKGEVEALAESVKAQLTSSGFEKVNLRKHPTIANRVAISAQKEPYTLTGTINRGPNPNCLGDEGKTFASLGFHKIELREGPPPGMPGSGMGPNGVRVQRPALPGGMPVRPPPPTAPSTPAPQPAPGAQPPATK